ncbi:hypothetical protein [Frigoribacterium sp. VKM Ac-2530]|uniref:hypothetical protein n=1 Tax=Frigoribacterium sp. VKM Ac-2530 TaxID=2783822 RepID=UPI00188D2D39|nr:hypothetical protein [Frigoribacterium sp. VKM Ac-2530]MBF4580376.1 hypothetical protein [Frigoribacterium sp. VKM Ac-2530]
MRSKYAAIGVAATLMLTVAAPTTSASASALSPLAHQDVEGISVFGAPALESQRELLGLIEDTPSAVIQDVRSGEILSVTVNPMVPTANRRNVCQAGDAFWASAHTPYTNKCFYGGKGTIPLPGSFSRQIFTGAYTAKGTYNINNRIMSTPRQAPGSTTILTGIAATTTGTIY